MRRSLVLGYGLISYLMFLGVFVYAVGFIGNIGVPTSLDAVPRVPLANAILINAALLTLFAVQHSVMARPAFKRMWTRIVPVPAERSTYVLFTNLCLIALFWLWEPMGGVIWDISSPVGYAAVVSLFAAGWILVLLSTFLINHFDLFGLRQVWLHYQGRKYEPLGFAMPLFYKQVRHPLYVGWLTVFWATPTMTAAHLMFALMTTIYIFVAIRFEERDLLDAHGEPYAEYRRRVPMMIPRLTTAPAVESASEEVTIAAS